MGIEIVREYVEQGVTGDASWSDRPAFQEMVSAILDNGVRTVIVENLTRLARAYVVQDAILVFLASKEVSLISAYTGEGVTAAFHGDPMKKAIIQMQAVFSALEKNSLVRKLKAARARKRAENGRCEGRKPFGERSGEKVPSSECDSYGASQCARTSACPSPRSQPDCRRKVILQERESHGRRQVFRAFSVVLPSDGCPSQVSRKLTSSPPPACPPSQHRKTALPAASEVAHNRSTQGSLGHFPHAVHKLH